jgi:plasmid stabilization system protein ParE
MGQVRYSDDAIADLTALRDYIAQHNPRPGDAVAFA